MKQLKIFELSLSKASCFRNILNIIFHESREEQIITCFSVKVKEKTGEFKSSAKQQEIIKPNTKLHTAATNFA